MLIFESRCALKNSLEEDIQIVNDKIMGDLFSFVSMFVIFPQ